MALYAIRSTIIARRVRVFAFGLVVDVSARKDYKPVGNEMHKVLTVNPVPTRSPKNG